jgi:small subunit ribosomal protein S6
MSRYDTTFIVNPQVGDDIVNASVNAITEIITSNKGEVLRERRIGSRRLAYPIARHSHGYYVTLIHDCDASVLPKLDRHFKLGDAYLRDLTIRYDGDPFRKSITDVMMGADSDERRPASSHKSNDGHKSESRSSTPSASVSTEVKPEVATPVVVATAEPAPETSREPVVETPSSDATSADTPSLDTTEDETL